MDSVLNVGVNDDVVQQLMEVTGNVRFALDVQRRFLEQFGTIVFKISKHLYKNILKEAKAHDGVSREGDLSIEALRGVVAGYKKLADIPTRPFDQLKLAIEAVFTSWHSARYISRNTVSTSEGLYLAECQDEKTASMARLS